MWGRWTRSRYRSRWSWAGCIPHWKFSNGDISMEMAIENLLWYGYLRVIGLEFARITKIVYARENSKFFSIPRAFWISLLSIIRRISTSRSPQLGGALGAQSLWHLYLDEKRKTKHMWEEVWENLRNGSEKERLSTSNRIQTGNEIMLWRMSCIASCNLLLPYLQWRHAFPRNTCFLQTSQKENLKTRVLSNLENKIFRSLYLVRIFSLQIAFRTCMKKSARANAAAREREREEYTFDQVDWY